MGLFISISGGCIASLQTNHNCVHHWAIEAGGQPVSVGVCKLCGKAKEFDNFIRLDNSDYSWVNVAAHMWRLEHGTDKSR